MKRYALAASIMMLGYSTAVHSLESPELMPLILVAYAEEEPSSELTPRATVMEEDLPDQPVEDSSTSQIAPIQVDVSYGPSPTPSASAADGIPLTDTSPQQTQTTYSDSQLLTVESADINAPLGGRPQAAPSHSTAISSERTSTSATTDPAAQDFSKYTVDDIKELMQKGRQELNSRLYDEAMETFTQLLVIDPDNRRARRYLKESQQLSSARRRVSTTLLHDVEFDKRVRDVEHAGIPYIEPRKIQVSGGSTAYSQEIREKEESAEISALRAELQDILVDLDFRNADLREVIRYLAEMSDINIVIDETALLQTAAPAPVVPTPQPVMPTRAPNQQNSQQQGGMQQGGMQQGGMQQGGMQQGGMQQGGMQQGGMQQGGMQQGGMQQGGMQQGGMQQGGMQQGQLQNGSQHVATTAGMETYKAPEPPQIETPRVTIFLRQIPLLTAMDIILRTKGLRYKIEHDFLWISTENNLAQEDLVTRIYTIQHAIGEFSSFASEPLNLSALGVTTGEDDGASQYLNQGGSNNSGGGS